MLNTGEDAQAKIEQEVVADLVGDYLFTDKAFVQSLSTGNRNVFQKIWDEIKYLCKTVTAGSKEARQLLEVKKIFEEAYRAETKNPTGEGGVRYALGSLSAQNDITANYQKTVDAVLQGTHTDKSSVLLGYTPTVYQELGMPSLPFVIGPGHIYATVKTEAEARLENRYSKKMHYHGLGDNAVKNIYNAAQDPLMIITSKDVNPKTTPLRSTHSVVAIVDVGTSNQHLLLPVEITAKRTVNGEEMDVNVLSSAYNKNVSELVREAVALENIGEVGVYYIKKGATLPADSGVQFPIHLSNKIASSGIIHSFSEKVNMNISDATQSQQFKRWFGDWQNHPENASKVVNADGTPKVMYHGSPAQFTVFDKKKAKSSGLYGRGFYFTDSAVQAGVYGNQYAVYLDVKQPLQAGNTAISRDQVRGFLEAVAENEDYSIENYGTYDIDTVLDAVMGSEQTGDAFRIIQDINATAIGDMVEATELFNSINGTNFDGIIVPTETVVFRPEQIKSATDNIGTFDGNNPDIRYSLSEQNQAETDSPFPLPWQIKGGDVALEFPLPPGYQEQSNVSSGNEDMFPVPEGYQEQTANVGHIDNSGIDAGRVLDYDSAINETEGSEVGNERREETRESFHRRANAQKHTIRERGQITCGYNPALNQTERAGRTEEALQNLGIQVIVHEGLGSRQGRVAGCCT